MPSTSIVGGEHLTVLSNLRTVGRGVFVMRADFAGMLVTHGLLPSPELRRLLKGGVSDIVIGAAASWPI